MSASSQSSPAPKHAAAGAQFAPLLQLALSTLAFAVGGMFAVASVRTATAFEEPHSYQGRFTNREFYADYSPTDGSVQIISVPLDGIAGLEGANVRTVDVNHFSELSSSVLDAAETDAAMHASHVRRGTDARARASATPRPAKTQSPPASQAPPRVREPVGRGAESNVSVTAVDEAASGELVADEPRGRSSVLTSPTPVARPQGARADATPAPRRTPTPKTVPPTPTRAATRTPERARGEATVGARATVQPTPPAKKKPAATPTPRRAPTSVRAQP